MDRQEFRLTCEELNLGYDDDALWGLYLYKTYTNHFQVPIPAKTAKNLTNYDLSSILSYFTVADIDFSNDIVATKTFLHCTQALEQYETDPSSLFPFE
ncbi:MAG: hypothetical protein IJO69_09130 [Ruminiclostridium sp.]|nr:hypothetical protein [Ruminiclostridium sp.]